METKRVHFSCDAGIFVKLESMKGLLGIKRDKIIENAINSFFKSIIANIAEDEGLIKQNPVIELDREFFNETTHPEVFDDICDTLNLKGNDGRVSTVKSIHLEIKQAHTGNK